MSSIKESNAFRLKRRRMPKWRGTNYLMLKEVAEKTFGGIKSILGQHKKSAMRKSSLNIAAVERRLDGSR
jgi:hypothetical protein